MCHHAVQHNRYFDCRCMYSLTLHCRHDGLFSIHKTHRAYIHVADRSGALQRMPHMTLYTSYTCGFHTRNTPYTLTIHCAARRKNVFYWAIAKIFQRFVQSACVFDAITIVFPACKINFYWLLLKRMKQFGQSHRTLETIQSFSERTAIDTFSDSRNLGNDLCTRNPQLCYFRFFLICASNINADTILTHM